MPLTPARCTQCGAPLAIDQTRKHALCPFCGTSFLVETAINHYTTHNETNIGNVENMHVEDLSSIEVRLRNAEACLTQLNDPTRAHEIFQSIANDMPSDWRGWWGMVRVATQDLTNAQMGYPKLTAVFEHVESAISVAPPDVRSNLEQQWDDFFDRVKDHARTKLGETFPSAWQRERVQALSSGRLLERHRDTCARRQAVFDIPEKLEKQAREAGRLWNRHGCRAGLPASVLIISLAIFPSLFGDFINGGVNENGTPISPGLIFVFIVAISCSIYSLFIRPAVKRQQLLNRAAECRRLIAEHDKQIKNLEHDMYMRQMLITWDMDTPWKRTADDMDLLRWIPTEIRHSS